MKFTIKELGLNFSVPELKYYILHSLDGNPNHLKKLQYKDEMVQYAYHRQNMTVTKTKPNKQEKNIRQGQISKPKSKNEINIHKETGKEQNESYLFPVRVDYDYLKNYKINTILPHTILPKSIEINGHEYFLEVMRWARGGYGELYLYKSKDKNNSLEFLVKIQEKSDQVDDSIVGSILKDKCGTVPIVKIEHEKLDKSLEYLLMQKYLRDLTYLMKEKPTLEKSINIFLEIRDHIECLMKQNMFYLDLTPGNVVELNNHYFLIDLGSLVQKNNPNPKTNIATYPPLFEYCGDELNVPTNEENVRWSLLMFALLIRGDESIYDFAYSNCTRYKYKINTSYIDNKIDELYPFQFDQTSVENEKVRQLSMDINKDLKTYAGVFKSVSTLYK